MVDLYVMYSLCNEYCVFGLCVMVKYYMIYLVEFVDSGKIVLKVVEVL